MFKRYVTCMRGCCCHHCTVSKRIQCTEHTMSWATCVRPPNDDYTSVMLMLVHMCEAHNRNSAAYGRGHTYVGLVGSSIFKWVRNGARTKENTLNILIKHFRIISCLFRKSTYNAVDVRGTCMPATTVRKTRCLIIIIIWFRNVSSCDVLAMCACAPVVRCRISLNAST